MFRLLSFGRKNIKNTLSIYIKSNDGSTLTINLEPQWDIKNLKEIVAPQLGLQPDEVKIIFAGKELSDSTTIEECDLGQQSILHAIRTKSLKQKIPINSTLTEELTVDESPSKPLCETLLDLQTQNEDEEREKAHFFVYCCQCRKLCRGKLRVRCASCKFGAFTVHRDPQCWDDVLKPKRIHGHCESYECENSRFKNNRNEKDNDIDNRSYAEFYFKCADHVSEGEKDFAAPLNLIKINNKNVPCLACIDISETVLVFPCPSKHVICLPCFLHYCRSRLLERQFIQDPDIGCTLSCPAGCDNSIIEEIHHFKLLKPEEYERYQCFATEEYVLKAGGVLCPQPGCGMGLLIDSNCRKITCQNGCNFVFCRNCLQGYHLGECLTGSFNNNTLSVDEYPIDIKRAAEARWDEASSITIQVCTKPCPKCRTPTERDGGCMHMICTRSGCGFEWCWICQIEWSVECMGAHWFG